MFRRETTGEILLDVGGEWDVLDRCYTGAHCSRGKFVDVQESQVEAVLHAAEWIRLYRAGELRDRVLMLGGSRRGGKTFILVLLLVALCLAIPGISVWMISPTIEQREELERVIDGGDPEGRWKGLPPGWFHYRGSPRFKFYVENGSSLRCFSGAVPRKRGSVFAFLLNEAQDMGDDAATKAIYGVGDRGGIAYLAANPPQRSRGGWARQLRKDLLAGKLRGTYYKVDPSLNSTVDRVALSDIADIVRSINRNAAAADSDDAWLPPGVVAYPGYSDKLVRLVPDMGEITTEFIRRRLKLSSSSSFAPLYLGGLDFQSWPHMVGVIYRIFGTLDRPLYYAVDELVIDEKDHRTEDDLLDEAFDRGYEPGLILWIGDATGQWQNGKHDRNDRDSFRKFLARRHRIEPPKKKKSDRGEYAGPPRIEDRLELSKTLMLDERLLLGADLDPKGHLVPKCIWLAESFENCLLGVTRTGRIVPLHPHAHITDAGTYATYWGEPEPVVTRPARASARASSFPSQRPGHGRRP